MKSYTNIEQSKKLAEILPIDSADMHYVRKTRDFMGNSVDGEWSHPKYGNPNSKYANYMVQNFTTYETIPCWSLSALLNILPETIEDEWAEYELIINMIYKKPEYVRLGDCHHSDFPSWDWDNEELLDNIVESVIWLNNNGYLRSQPPTNEFVGLP